MAAPCARSPIDYCASWSPCLRLEPSSIPQRHERRSSVTFRRKLHEPLDRGWGVLLRHGVGYTRDFSGDGEFVFRGAPHGPPQFPTERFFTRLLHERTSVPVPWPYRIDDSCDFFPWSYAIMPRMPGLQVTDRKVRRDLTGAELRAIARAMAYNLVA